MAHQKEFAKVVEVFIENGTLTFLKTDSADIFLEQGETITRRASHVEPGPRYERWFFHLLRFLFGDKGRVSNWTRTWFTLWRVNTCPVGGPILRWKDVRTVSWREDFLARATPDAIAYWTDRQAAIDAEVDFLNRWFMERR